MGYSGKGSSFRYIDVRASYSVVEYLKEGRISQRERSQIRKIRTGEKQHVRVCFV